MPMWSCFQQENLIGTLLAIFGNVLVSMAVSIQVSVISNTSVRH